MSTTSLCRICLTRNPKPKKMKVLDSDLLQRIEELSGIELKLHEGYPKMLCFQCMEMLDISSKFRQMCLSSEDTLLSLLIKPELKDEPQEIDEDDNEDIQSENDEFFEEFIEAHEVEDIAEIADFANDCVKIVADEQVDDDDEDGTMERVVSDSESILSLIKDEKPPKRLVKKVKGKRGRKPKDSISKTSPTTTSKRSIEPTIKKPGKRGRKKLDESQPGGIMCEICGNIYKQRNLLNMHMRRHMEEKPFECEICGKTFACPSEIRRHMRTHTGEKPFKCQYCDRTFADRSTNIKHERIHTNERPFHCSTCGKSFTYSNVLKNHMLTHTGEKNFPCIPCNKTFSRKHQLDQHCATITHQQTVRCLNGTYMRVGDMNVENVGDILDSKECVQYQM